MAFDLLMFCDRNRISKFDIGDVEEWELDVCEVGTYRSDSLISGDILSSSSNKLLYDVGLKVISGINSVVSAWMVLR